MCVSVYVCVCDKHLRIPLRFAGLSVCAGGGAALPLPLPLPVPCAAAPLPPLLRPNALSGAVVVVADSGRLLPRGGGAAAAAAAEAEAEVDAAAERDKEAERRVAPVCSLCF